MRRGRSMSPQEWEVEKARRTQLREASRVAHRARKEEARNRPEDESECELNVLD